MAQEDEGAFHGLVICDENILVRAAASSREDIIRQLGSLLQEHGFVKDTYIQAVLDREVIFPTGLQTPILGFAIPHTDTEHVNRSAVAIATLSQPIEFQAMGDPDSVISVEVVMMLAIRDPKMVVPVLRNVISILEDEEAIKGLTRASNPVEVREIISTHIQKMENKTSENLEQKSLAVN